MTFNRGTAAVAVLLAALVAQPASAAGECVEALANAQETDAVRAEDWRYPVLCNWNYVFAIEDKMLRLGDLESRRKPEAYHDQIDPDAIRRAQRRVGLPETGLLDLSLFTYYMSLPG